MQLRTRTRLGSGLVLVVLLLATACGGDEPAGPGTVGDPAASAKPTQEALVALLEKLQGLLDAKDYTTAATHMVAFPGMTDEDMQGALATFVEEREISAAGIKTLNEKGTFGPLLEVLPDRAKYLASKAGVDPTVCWVLIHDTAEVAVHWDGKTMRFIRLNNVGKLD